MKRYVTCFFLICLLQMFICASPFRSIFEPSLIEQALPTLEILPKLTLTSDNVVTKVLALKDGGSDIVPLAGLPNLENWTKPTTISLQAYPHMTGIQITGINSGKFSRGNPAGLLATVTYKCNGKVEIINTSSKWQCRYGKNDWTPARAIAPNSGPSIWNRNGKHQIADIPGNAQWIWNQVLSATPVDCRIIFPCEKHKEILPQLTLTADNVVTNTTAPIEPDSNITAPNEPASNSTEPIEPTSNTTETTKDECDKLKEARKLNKELSETVRKLDKQMNKHANLTSLREGKMKDINNTYSKFPVNNSISYKKFLRKIEASYQTGYYDKQINKLAKSLKNFKFDKNIVEKCENQNKTVVPTPVVPTPVVPTPVVPTPVVPPKNETMPVVPPKNETMPVVPPKNETMKSNIAVKTDESNGMSEDWDMDSDESPSFIQNNKMKKLNLRGVKSLMTEKELHQAYSLLLQKSTSLLRNI